MNTRLESTLVIFGTNFIYLPDFLRYLTAEEINMLEYRLAELKKQIPSEEVTVPLTTEEQEHFDNELLEENA